MGQRNILRDAFRRGLVRHPDTNPSEKSQSNQSDKTCPESPGRDVAAAFGAVDAFWNHLFSPRFFLTKCQLFEIVSIMAEKKTCLDTALAFLARREHAVKELKTKLLRKNYPAAEVAQTIEKLIKNNLLSNTRYADARARYRATVSRWGATRIRQELLAAGVCADDAEMSLRRLSNDGIVMQNVAKLSLKGAQTSLKRAKGENAGGAASDLPWGAREKRLERQKAYDKLLAKLLRKGFTLGEAKAAIAEAQAEME